MAPAHESPVGGTSRTAAFALFVVNLLAFVVETQTTQYLQTMLGYKQPYLLLYIVHSCLLFTFPIHLAYVLFTTKHGLRPLLKGLSYALAAQMTARDSPCSSPIAIGGFTMRKMVILVICITMFYTLPALLWFTAVSLASVTDVTAIWNANAFFVYVFSVRLLGVKWGSLHLFAVIIATLGVLAVAYGGAPVSSVHSQLVKANLSSTPAPFVGNLLTLVASALYGLYQVLYKKYVALQSDPELIAASSHYHQIPDGASDIVGEVNEATVPAPHANDIIYPPPFGLHSNLITAAIGLCTLLMFWIPIPFLHYYQIEIFRLPPNTSTIMAIASIATSGVIFNAGFMILLGIWGPIVTSVGNLLTIVLVLISDLSFGSVPLTFGGLFGTSMIVCAFGILVYDML